ncbi:MAG: hypothetical protein DMG70_20135 [Acidobacteria bacterium]|nr:MAG: hypothetical protein DMG70_20135 [Acidobacteriota bacterium]
MGALQKIRIPPRLPQGPFSKGRSAGVRNVPEATRGTILGAICGFCDLVEAINDPDHERHEEMREWIGDDYDSETCSVDEATGSHPCAVAARVLRH